MARHFNLVKHGSFIRRGTDPFGNDSVLNTEMVQEGWVFATLNRCCETSGDVGTGPRCTENKVFLRRNLTLKPSWGTARHYTAVWRILCACKVLNSSGLASHKVGCLCLFLVHNGRSRACSMEAGLDNKLIFYCRFFVISQFFPSVLRSLCETTR